MSQRPCPTCGQFLPDAATRCECGARLGGVSPTVSLFLLGFLPMVVGLYVLRYGNWRHYDPPYYLAVLAVGVGFIMSVYLMVQAGGKRKRPPSQGDQG